MVTTKMVPFMSLIIVPREELEISLGSYRRLCRKAVLSAAGVLNHREIT